MLTHIRSVRGNKTLRPFISNFGRRMQGNWRQTDWPELLLDQLQFSGIYLSADAEVARNQQRSLFRPNNKVNKQCILTNLVKIHSKVSVTSQMNSLQC